MKTDFNVYPEAPLTSLPAAGGRFTDPAFGADILRFTGEGDGQNCGTYYSYWPTFNADSTRLLARCDAGALLVDFDPAGFKVLGKREMPTIPGVGNPTFEGASWDGADADLLHITANASVYAYRPSTNAYTLRADAQGEMPGEYIKQPSWSRDGSRVAFSRKRYGENVEPGWAVFDVPVKRIVARGDGDIDEVTISQSGKFLLVKLAAQGAGVINALVVNLDTGAQVELIDDADASPGHGDAGMDSYVGYDNFGNRVTWVDLANPKAFKVLHQFDSWGYGFGHASMRAADESWALISFFGTTDQGLFRNEVVQLATDGSGRVRRLFHHRSAYRNYYDSPRANISLDGRFVAFTSNMGGTRTDLYVAKISETATPTPAPPPAPVPPVEPPQPPVVTPPPTPQPPVTPTPPPDKRKVAWPKQESKWEAIADAQAAEGYRFKRALTGDFAEFVKFK